MTDQYNEIINKVRQWLAAISSLVILLAFLLSPAVVQAASSGSIDIETITWKITSTTTIGSMNYHIRKITAVNGVDVDSSDDLKSSWSLRSMVLMQAPVSEAHILPGLHPKAAEEKRYIPSMVMKPLTKDIK